MAEPLKTVFNHDMVDDMASHIAAAWPDFDRERFTTLAAKGLETLEFKERYLHIAAAMKAGLPDDFSEAAAILTKALPGRDKSGISGWAVMALNAYVSENGRNHFDTAMTLLKEMTPHLTSEYGIRFFILDDRERAFGYLCKWARDPDYHVRRLASEGCRPRLPWAIRLPALIRDPSPILPILEMLKDDSEEYVRRSVANNLNDIAKDHPNLVADIAAQWLADCSPEREKLLRHACRTLIKQGHRKTLGNFGFLAPDKLETRINIATPHVKLGAALEFDLDVSSKASNDQNLLIDFAVHHVKANGVRTPKVFKLKSLTLPGGGSVTIHKRHPIRPVTTRVYYPGTHELEVMINGTSVGSAPFELEV